jgi:hypothetical protein
MARLRNIENAPNFEYDETKTTRIYAEDLQGLDTRIYDLESATDKVPSGGTTGQVLTKKSNSDFDLEWKAGGSGGLTVDINTKVLNDMGAGIKGQTIYAGYATTFLGLNDRYITGSVCYIPENAEINQIQFYTYTKGVFTADQNNKLGLYSFSSGTFTKVAETANDEYLFKNTSQRWRGGNLTASYNATAGVYAVVALYNNSAQTTQPSLGSLPVMPNVEYGKFWSGGSIKLGFHKWGYDDLPASFTMASVDPLNQMMVIYLK